MCREYTRGIQQVGNSLGSFLWFRPQSLRSHSQYDLHPCQCSVTGTVTGTAIDFGFRVDSEWSSRRVNRADHRSDLQMDRWCDDVTRRVASRLTAESPTPTPTTMLRRQPVTPDGRPVDRLQESVRVNKPFRPPSFDKALLRDQPQRKRHHRCVHPINYQSVSLELRLRCLGYREGSKRGHALHQSTGQ